MSRARRRRIILEIHWANRIKARDRFCQWEGCGATVNLEAHHVYPKSRYPDLRLMGFNGLTLCRDHHRRWHASSRKCREWWAERWPARFLALKVMLDAS